MPYKRRRQETTAAGPSGSARCSREVTVVAVELRVHSDEDLSSDYEGNPVLAVMQAKEKLGANIVLLPELCFFRYFPQELSEEHFAKAETYEDSKILHRMAKLARETEVVLVVSFFERQGNCFFNSVCVIDADGERLGIYRKSHIPMGPGYEEKYYFAPGDTGFKVFDTKFAAIGVGICWDQWFPECARAMALQGAELLLYPTAIGSEPHCPELHSLSHWQNVMKGHAAANIMPVVAANRRGTETYRHYNGGETSIDFYGHSFIADQHGEIVQEVTDETEFSPSIHWVAHTFDLDAIEKQRRSWGIFRDRRPDLYKPLLSM
ncbi:N-carbamoylputrescine amidase [Chloropicon primus]|uniref:N-carbamoylputrescine amidase n=2 Tax=Chloropicon primus TaxID=1764295 RepID=A0A5B8MIG5_9CHLO|nr:N-carbamoylputrescine amidase [Chloropicon primus]UPQ99293.1 N-carbamoylputrescine amidase [Chloropicon primus]|eukprot:QDZ20081.1 N-carbamoylputrescine amidase [Chloropicon primus]